MGSAPLWDEPWPRGALGCQGQPSASPPHLPQNVAMLMHSHPKSTAIPNPSCSRVSTPCLPSPPKLQMNPRAVPHQGRIFGSLVPHHRPQNLPQGPGEGAELSLTHSAEIPTPFLWEQSHSSPLTPCKPQSQAGGCRGGWQGHGAEPAGSLSTAQG